MDISPSVRLILRLALLLVLIPLMGLSPQNHRFRSELESARRASTRGYFLDASIHLANAARQMPACQGLWEQAGRYALQGNDPEKALRFFKKARQTSSSPALLIAIGDAQMAGGQPSAALRTWQAATEQSGPSASLYQRLWQAHFQIKDYPATIADLQALAALQPNDPDVRYQLGLLLATQKPETALAHLLQSSELDPQRSPQVEILRSTIISARVAEDPAYTLLTAGRALASIDEWELSVEAFRQATLTRPDYAEAWAFLGEALQHIPSDIESNEVASTTQEISLAYIFPEASNDPNVVQGETGREELQKSLDLDPESLSANLLMALYWNRRGRYDLALQTLQSAVEQKANNPVLQVELGNAQALSGNLVEAQLAFQKATELAPYDPAYHRLLARFSILYEYQVREIGLRAARQAVLLNPQDPKNLDVMAQALIKLDDRLNARRFLLRALAIDPNFAFAHVHLGVLYLLEGDNQAAYVELEWANRLASDGPAGEQAQRLLRTYFP